MPRSIFIEYARLARLHSAVLTGLTPVLGALAVGMMDLWILVLLFFIGICAHVFGFVFNEYMDIEIDKKAKFLSEKPLVKGTISKTAAITFAFGSVILGYVLLILLAHTQRSIQIFGIIFYTLAWLAIGVYDLTSKRVRGSDLALALWTAALCLFGGFAVQNPANPLLFIIAGLAFFQLWIQNIIAGLKDIIHDQLCSVTTTPLRMGVKFRNNRLLVPGKFQGGIYGLKYIHLVLVFIPIIFLWINVDIVQIIIISCLLITNFILVASIFYSTTYSRPHLLRIIGLHEILSYSIVPIMLYSIIGLRTVVILLLVPVLWLALSLKILYGRLLPKI